MKCCAECIGDRHLAGEVIPDLSTETGVCSYCGTGSQPLVNPIQLRDNFELLVGIYRRTENGRTLAEWLKADWAMFQNKNLDTFKVDRLLGDILDDHEIVTEVFEPSERCNSDTLDRWGAFREELMYVNRFFPKTGIDLARLEELLPHLLLSPGSLPNRWYRARIQEGALLYDPTAMGAPPKRRTKHGRANPAGIPYLYLASDADTAIAEVRPHPGEMASVAEFEIATGLKIIDLSAPRRTVSPFVLADENKVALLRGDITFLEHLGEELRHPVVPKVAAIDYTPSQYLCEFAKHCGFDGISYGSSTGNGMNIALFDPERAVVQGVASYHVSRVVVESAKIL